ncbi:DegV family protein [Caldisalinibacter kiritimatiensis]|uniref:DegV n=1 Tax=Caldisalinibacter kiritimatiensis TaxID=1304284 RepID=R1AQQ7_9FIRM|nr:DegV family protein [Caldisalinibacter kiritimatiensis]EOC99462.1 DegV [Caldisalinibacter kiritimatiensis]
MSKIKIITDSTCDLSPELIKQNNISVIPLYVTFDDESYKDGVNIKPKELFETVDKVGSLPKTSAAPPSDFYDVFKKNIDDGYDIIYISISSKLSTTMQNAILAASNFPENKIEIVDSLNLSTGVGLLVLKACDYANQGLSIKEIANKLRELAPKVKTEFVINTLDYLYKGGRCNALQSFFGGMLKIKPIVKVVDGKMILGQKPRGKKKALKIMLNTVLNNKDNIDPSRIMITHSLGSEKEAEYLKKELEENTNAKEVIITNAGCVISSHCGPKTIGILYINE